MLRFMCILVLYLWSGYDLFFFFPVLCIGLTAVVSRHSHVYFTYFLIQISIFLAQNINIKRRRSQEVKAKRGG